MTLALILLAVIVGVGLALYIEHQIHLRRNPSEPVADDRVQEEECCGMHVTCERDSLLASVSKEIEYYDDEELDRYAGIAAGEYGTEQIEEFRDILLSMKSDDIAGWVRSLQLRGVELPTEIRDDVIMIIGEARRNRTAAHA